MANLQRGFRRIAWVVVVLATPVVGVFAYALSETLSGYEPTLIIERFPDTEGQSISKRPVYIEDVGIFYLPSELSEADIDKQMPILVPKATTLQLSDSGKKRASLREFAKSVKADHPEYSDLDDITLTKRVLTKHPEYRDTVDFREFEIVPVFVKSLLWATGMTALVVLVLATILHGSISVVSWIARGFKSSA